MGSTSAKKKSFGDCAQQSVLPEAVLVVDGDPLERTALVEMLAAVGIPRDAVTTSASLAKARQAITAATFDCVLLGMSLLDASSFEGLAVLAAAAPNAMVVVVIPETAPQSVVSVALAEGADECVARPDLNAKTLETLIVRAAIRRVGDARAESWREQVSSVLDSIQVSAAVLDGSGRIAAVNRAWRRGAWSRGGTPAATGVGVNYLTVCDQASGARSEGAEETATGIRAVLNGDLDRFTLDYYCPANGIDAWAAIRVSPLGEFGGGALVVHLDVTAIKLADDQLRYVHGGIHFLLDGAAPIFALIDPEGVVSHVSEATVGVLERSSIGSGAFERIEAADRGRARACFQRVMAKPWARERICLRVTDGAGRSRSLDLLVANMLDDPTLASVVIVGSDITAGARHQIAVRLQAQLLRRLPAAVVMTDDRGGIVYWNDQATALYGPSADDALGRSAGALDIGLDSGATGELMASAPLNGSVSGDCDLRRPDGSVIPVNLTIERVTDSEIGFSGVVSMGIDIRQRRELEATLAFQSLHDPLTGLPNHRLFVDQLETALARASRTGLRVGVVAIDLDDFEALNARYGHDTADQVLMAVSELIAGALRPGDVLARLGGNEFVVCCDGLDDPAAAYHYAEGLARTLDAPFRITGELVALTASAGVAVSAPKSRAEEILRHARAAMYQVKQAGKGRIELFDDAVAIEIQRKRQQAAELRDALEGGQIVAYFQPVVNLATEELIGFEALARWRHPERGIVPPDEFIPLAEEHGLIGQVGLTVLRDACAALATWRRHGLNQSLTVAVNVSGRQLTDPDLVGTMQAAIAEAGIPATQLCVEVTESTLVEAGLGSETLGRLKALGVEVAIDDFGTGYSSLGRLHAFPLDFLKIDRSFVDALIERPDATGIIGAVIGLARALGLRTIAEGVETRAQAEHLAAMGVDLAQGYLWGRPVDAGETARIVAAAGRHGLQRWAG